MSLKRLQTLMVLCDQIKSNNNPQVNEGHTAGGGLVLIMSCSFRAFAPSAAPLLLALLWKTDSNMRQQACPPCRLVNGASETRPSNRDPFIWRWATWQLRSLMFAVCLCLMTSDHFLSALNESDRKMSTKRDVKLGPRRPFPPCTTRARTWRIKAMRRS